MKQWWDTLRVFNTARFSVALQCAYEEDYDSSWWDDEMRDKMERGVYHSYCFRVVVLCDGREIGADYLGDSIYENPLDFAREHYGIAPRGRADNCRYCCYFPDMLREAIRQARATLCKAPRVRCA